MEVRPRRFRGRKSAEDIQLKENGPIRGKSHMSHLIPSYSQTLPGSSLQRSRASHGPFFGMAALRLILVRRGHRSASRDKLHLHLDPAAQAASKLRQHLILQQRPALLAGGRGIGLISRGLDDPRPQILARLLTHELAHALVQAQPVQIRPNEDPLGV